MRMEHQRLNFGLGELYHLGQTQNKTKKNAENLHTAYSPDTQAVFWRNHEEMMWTVDHPDQGTGDKGWGHRVSRKHL